MNQRPRHVAQHHPHDEHPEDVLHPAAQHRHQHQHPRRSDPSRAREAHRLPCPVGSPAQQRRAEDEERHSKPCPRAYAQQIRVRQRIAEHRLHLQPAHGERHPNRRGHHHPHHPDGQHDGPRRLVRHASREYSPHRLRPQCRVPRQQVGGEQRRHRRSQSDEQSRVPSHALFQLPVVIQFSLTVFRMQDAD